jgi:hypothetical protein
MNKSDWAYIAGLFDGEGCVSAATYCKNSRQYIVACIHITNTHLPVLRKVRRLLGGRIRKKNGSGQNTRRQAWTWYVGYREAIPILYRLLPFLVIKRSEALLFIRLFSRGAGYNRFQPDNHARRVGLVQRIRALKKREWK